MENMIYLKKTDEIVDVELVGYGHSYSSTEADYCDCNCDCDCSEPCFC